MTLAAAHTSSAAESSALLNWKQLPALPDAEGFAGSFGGVHNGALIVGGGANFPGKRPWEGGTKIWYDTLFVMEKSGGAWKTGFKLPRPLGYGVSITHESGIICIGGSDAKQHHTDVFSLSWSDGKIQTKTLPCLPKPCANMCGALAGNTIYVAGGLEKPDSTNCLKTFWSLDLSKPNAQWQELEPWPGAERMLAAAGTHENDFFLFGGTALKKNADGKVVREWLTDAYRFTPGKGWKRLAGLPRPCVAAPSPLAPSAKARLLLFGGDDGAQVNTQPTEHKGFPRGILMYDTIANIWLKAGEVPFSLVTTPCVSWNGAIVIPGGEARPGIRSTEVWAGKLP